MREPSKWETMLLEQIRKWGLPEPQTEFVFAPPRKWRFDFAWPQEKLACEVEGATWVAGRHTRGSGFEADCCKYNEAAMQGWTVIRVTSNMIKQNQAIRALWRVLSNGDPMNDVLPATLILVRNRRVVPCAMTAFIKKRRVA